MINKPITLTIRLSYSQALVLLGQLVKQVENVTRTEIKPEEREE